MYDFYILPWNFDDFLTVRENFARSYKLVLQVSTYLSKVLKVAQILLFLHVFREMNNLVNEVFHRISEDFTVFRETLFTDLVKNITVCGLHFVYLRDS